MEEIITILLAVAFILVPAIIMHWKVSNYFLASILAAGIGTFLFFITNYIKMGYIGPFTMIALKNAFAIYLVTALIIGLVFYVKRKKQKEI